MDFAKAIRIARSIAGMSQSELAARSSLDRSYLSLIEGGKRKPTLETLNQLSKSLGIPFHLLSLLATERKDTSKIDQAQVERLATELTKLLLEGPSDDEQRTGRPSRRKSERPRVSPRNKQERIA